MSGKRDEAAGEAARYNASLASGLFQDAKGPLSEMLEMLKGGLAGGPNAVPESVSKQFSLAQQQNDIGYDSAIRTNRELAGARARSSGQVYSTGELDSAIAQGTFALNQSREAATRNLKFQEAQAGMGQYNQMLGLLGQGANTSLGLAQGMAGAQLGAIGQQSNTNPWGGAAAGATAGSAFGPWGTVIGGVLGGVGGHMGGR